MADVLPSTTREILLADIPDGLPRPEDFAVTQKPVPVPGPGQVVVRNPAARPSPSPRRAPRSLCCSPPFSSCPVPPPG
ncbi:hypothetical protein [Streptomyces sp. NPDC050759]|uniref:hypothetical protein n=1 Tax=Streptomyces sp. NPDC050759 TaxID=3365635 RepID=UPI00379C01F3